MPLLILLLLAIMIAQLGFWDTLAAILGGVAMIALFLLIALATLALVGYTVLRRLRRRQLRGGPGDRRLPRVR